MPRFYVPVVMRVSAVHVTGSTRALRPHRERCCHAAERRSRSWRSEYSAAVRTSHTLDPAHKDGPFVGLLKRCHFTGVARRDLTGYGNTLGQLELHMRLGGLLPIASKVRPEHPRDARQVRAVHQGHNLTEIVAAHRRQ